MLRVQLVGIAQEAQNEITARARALLKEQFPHHVFLYGTERVGITATGDQGVSELFPNPNHPVDFEGATAPEVYHDFNLDLAKYVLEPEGPTHEPLQARGARHCGTVTPLLRTGAAAQGVAETVDGLRTEVLEIR